MKKAVWKIQQGNPMPDSVGTKHFYQCADA